jgi:DNA polymerase III delta prime subunit
VPNLLKQYITTLARLCLNLCPTGLKVMRSFWGFIFIAVLPNAVIAFVFLSRGTPLQSLYLWPITEWAWKNHLLAGFLLFAIILLTGLFWIGSRRDRNDKHQSSLTTVAQQNHDIFIRALRKEYSRQMEQSLQGMTKISLEITEHPDIAGSPGQLVFHPYGAKEYLLPPGTSIAQIYDEAGYGLLILGEPGVGKTTTLLDLAQELLIRTQTEPSKPIPVILNLSSWADKRPLFTDWVINQLVVAYRVPHHLSEMWVQSNRLLLLLDGLDEVKESARTACIEAINSYRENNFVPFVVCCRSQEYSLQSEKLALSSAIEIQPLTKRQVMEYLNHVGKHVAAVRAALQANPILFELVTTPLMLQVVILTYRGKTVKDLPGLGSAEEQRQQIFASYVKRMLEDQKRSSEMRYNYKQAVFWLCWLAQQMKQHNQTVFYIERMQPKLLSDNHSRHIYQLFAMKLLSGIDVGLIFAVLCGATGTLFISGILHVVSRYALYGDIASGLIPGLFFIGLGLKQPNGIFRTDEIKPAEIINYKLVKHPTFRS